jgi:phosphoribosylformylglycinamidine (FGAM) synthase-like enzyme
MALSRETTATARTQPVHTQMHNLDTYIGAKVAEECTVKVVCVGHERIMPVLSWRKVIREASSTQEDAEEAPE